MNWLKSTWTALSAILVVALAIFAAANAQRQKSASRKWQETAVNIEEGSISRGTLTAEAASKKAAVLNDKANAKKAAAEARINKLKTEDDDEIADVLDRFRRS